MINVAEAVALVLQHVGTKNPVQLPLSDSLGLVLAEAVTSDVDSPPHDKSMVDGYAVRTEDVQGDSVQLRVVDEITAGMVPQLNLTSGTAARIMTGAPIPEGASAVVMVEHTQLLEENNVQIRAPRLQPGANIMRRGQSLRHGEHVLESGRLIGPIEIGLLAETGCHHPRVYPRPNVAILATGNELVPADYVPAAGQIRNSNGPLLSSLVTQAGGVPRDLGIGRDREEELDALIGCGLEQDVLLLSGGVSAGILDLVPACLVRSGVRQVFHKVQLRPGKPLWFGVYSTGSAQNTNLSEEGRHAGTHPSVGGRLVFGLPGNPVSSLVCFELFVRPALAALAGRTSTSGPARAELMRDFTVRGDRHNYLPAILHDVGGRATVDPVNWQGSADQRALASANCLAYFPPGDATHPAGTMIRVHPLPRG